MCVNSLSQGLNVDLPKAGLKPQTSRSESRASTTGPRRHIFDDRQQIQGGRAKDERVSLLVSVKKKGRMFQVTIDIKSTI
ncbi:hypothetical protein ElyMa_003957800 [Elysia marginata]|uniref:Uncharacterized protein n=1 Tax=Elysia marginata TaxID=1093978 RepID=A0AAV4FU52_9GAST|nr:hypothetical protein ElyMa_003957800 [Elysia marginata]